MLDSGGLLVEGEGDPSVDEGDPSVDEGDPSVDGGAWVDEGEQRSPSPRRPQSSEEVFTVSDGDGVGSGVFEDAGSEEAGGSVPEGDGSGVGEVPGLEVGVGGSDDGDGVSEVGVPVGSAGKVVVTPLTTPDRMPSVSWPRTTTLSPKSMKGNRG